MRGRWVRPVAGACVCLLTVLAMASGTPSPAPLTSPRASRVGSPESVSPGITETVDEIMARDRSAVASAGVEALARPDGASPTGSDPASPLKSAWPVSEGSVETSVLASSAPESAGTSFKAIGLSESGFIPPDVAGDVGPTQVLVHVNGRVRVFSKSGASGTLNTTGLVFWSSVANGSQPIYPQVRYDRLSGRWILMAVNSVKPNNRIMIAVQTTPGTITGSSSFTFYQFNQGSGGGSGDTTNYCDSPRLGIDASALYIGCNMHTTTGVFARATVYVVRKSSILPAPGTLVVTAFRDVSHGSAGPGPFTPVGVDNDDPRGDTGYFIGTDVATHGLLQVLKVSDPGGTPALSEGLPLTVLQTTPPIAQPASGSAVNLDAGDERLVRASIHANKITGAVTLWTSHANEVDATCASVGGGGRNGARWYQIAGSAPTVGDPLGGSPVLVQSGTLCDPSSTDPQGFIYPSVVETGQGNMVLGSSFAAANLFAGAASAGRLRTDPLGATQAATTIQSGLSSYTFVSGGRNRWGDYSFTDVDPVDDQTVWTFQEYADSTRNNWAVRAVQLKAPPPPALSGLQDAICFGRASVMVTLNGTADAPVPGAEFFDPGPDPGGPGFASHLTATVTGGVTVNGSPTLVLPANPSAQPVLQVTLSLDTTAATAGLKNITLRNPDGQTTTGIGVIRVDHPAAPTATNNGPVCVGGTLQLSVPTVSGASYSWTGPNGFTSDQQNPILSNVTAAAAGTYTVAFTESGCEVPPASTTVQVLDEGAGCEDGDLCNSGDTCVSGTCQSGTPIVCDDHNVCTADTCNPATGCQFTDTTAVACGDGNVCTSDLCDPATGCYHVGNTVPCNDGNPCTTGDTCGDGTCHPGGPTDCNDANACTADACDPSTGCLHTDISASCNDANLCTADSCEPAVGCVHTDTTATSCNDHNVCTNDACDPISGCFHTDNPSACDDGNACTTSDACVGGTCVGGAPLACDDGNVCTFNSCDPATGCVFTDTTSVDCNDANVCTADLCDPATGCYHADNTSPCSDGSACTTGDTCAAGVCQPGAAVSCDDGNPCTDDSCDPATGCVHVDNTAPCDDGNACTAGDTCGGGSCHGGAPLVCDDGLVCTDDLCAPSVGCYHTLNTAACDDGNACTTGETCLVGICQGGDPVDCDDANPCTTDTCYTNDGCDHTPNTAPCDDGNACTSGDTCAEGACVPGAAIACHDGNACTLDSCDPVLGCVFTDDSASCDDHNVCTANSCNPTTGCVFTDISASCGDGNVCTDDSCDPATGCVHAPNTASCDDANFCTTGDTCAAGSCHGGTPTVCDDGNACTANSCDPATGCVYTDISATCNDGNVCTDDSCDPQAGCVHAANTAPCNDGNACTAGDTCGGGACQPGGPTSCDDGNACTADSCDPTSGCVFTDISASCGDGNVCTDDSCDPQVGCVHVDNAAPCSDGNACTTGDTCSAGTCQAGGPVACDDQNACTADTCDPATGCVFTDIGASCDDGNACTANSCDPGTGCVYTDISATCNDGNVCTDDSCDPQTGCVHAANTAPCNDGNACTAGDTCGGGNCQPGAGVTCDDGNACTSDTCDPTSGCVFTDISASCGDGNVCTDDSCDPQVGCVHVDNAAPCSDGNACTTGDTCSAGTCQAGGPVACDDQNACTADTCDPATGCVFTDIGASCDDGNACTANSCDPATGCVYTDISATCNDGNVCTDDSCDPQTGCVHAANTAPCNDGNACTAGDTCGGGSCQPGAGVTCDDGNACTSDTCDPTSGCVFTDISASCGDGNVCTDDSCDPQVGCVHVDNAAPCSDGNACTTGDTCSAGTCQAGGQVACDDQNVCTADTCNPAIGCVFTDVTALLCDDGNICTNDLCAPASGCFHANNTAPCDDGNACTSGDTCGGGTCGGIPIVIPEVHGVTVAGHAPTTLSWTASAPGAHYDIASSTLSDMRTAGTFGATCLVDDAPGTSYEDTHAGPSAGAGFYYLIRAQSACGTGTYGANSAGIERTPLLACP